MSWQDRWYYRHYFGRKDWMSGTEEFWRFVAAYIAPGKRVLELGCGPKNPTSMYLRSRYGEITGLDIDSDAASNPALGEFRHYGGGRWPCEDGEFEGIVADYVWEHVEDPDALVSEAGRVLAPGGVLVFRAPNLMHYAALVSKLTPHWFHVRVSGALRGLPDQAHDPYPAFYRMNTASALRRLMGEAGLRELELRVIEKEPSYARCSRLLFIPLMAYERIVNASSQWHALRANFLGAYQSPTLH